MLDVEKSNAAAASTGLGRVGGGRVSGGAVRCLFGPPDVEGTREFQRAELRKIKEEQMRRWNFDFDEGRPLRGRYRWEPYPTDEAASASSGAPHSMQPRDGATAAATATARVARRQLSIPDYFPKRKRLTGSDIATPKAMCCAAGGEATLVRPLAVRASDRPPVPLSTAAPSSSLLPPHSSSDGN